MDKLDTYLDAIDDHLPTLREDLVLLAEVADTYNVAAPDLLGVLDNVTVTSKTIVQQRKELDVFFGDVAGLARHLQPDARRERDQPDPGRRADRAGDAAAGGLLAGVPLPAQGPGPLPTPAGQRVPRAT